MKKKRLFVLLLGTAVWAVMMMAGVMVSFADEQGATAVYVKVGDTDSVTLYMIHAGDWFDPDDYIDPDASPLDPNGSLDPDASFDPGAVSYSWEPLFDEGDAVIITENGVETKYICDHGEIAQSGNDGEDAEFYGYFDDEGNSLSDVYECNMESSRYTIPFEWIGGVPEESGVYAEYRYILKKKGAPDSEAIKTNPIQIYITPTAVIDGLQYNRTDDGTAETTYAEDQERIEYTIKPVVALDDGKEYSVTHVTRAFGNCTNMESVSIPDSVQSIEKYAFLGADNLKQITIPPSVTEIGEYAFGYIGDYDYFYGLTIEGKIDGFVVYAKAGSVGAWYALENGFELRDLEAEEAEKAADEAYAKAKYTPVKGKITKAKSGKKKMTVKWKKVSGATGYEFRYSMDKSFGRGVKTKVVKSYSKKGVTIKGLKKKKVWYVQVRALRTVNGKTYYGDWSVAKSVKVK